MCFIQTADHANCTVLTRQHELLMTQIRGLHICPERSRSWTVGIEYLSGVQPVCEETSTMYYIPGLSLWNWASTLVIANLSVCLSACLIFSSLYRYVPMIDIQGRGRRYLYDVFGSTNIIYGNIPNHQAIFSHMIHPPHHTIIPYHQHTIPHTVIDI